MSERPVLIADRPEHEDESPDVLSQVFRSLRLQRTRFSRLELRAPWGIRRQASNHFRFMIVARGGALITVEGQPPITLGPGDVAITPHGDETMMRDTTGRRLPARDLDYAPCASSVLERWKNNDGPLTELLGGVFAFTEPATHPIFVALPKVLHLRADDPDSAGWLGATVQLIVSEANAARDGSAVVLERLAEVLVVQALRLHARHGQCPSAGLCALADPAIGSALKQVHEQPGVDWTVERLATKVGLSRSSFSARFTELVGEPPLRYVTRWRVTRASELLRDGHDSIANIASNLGYESEAAFHRAFKRWRGVGPGAFRKTARAQIPG